MIDKCSSYSKMTVFVTLSDVGNADRMLRIKFFVVCKARGLRHYELPKCPAPGTHHSSNAGGLLGGGDARGWNIN